MPILKLTVVNTVEGSNRHGADAPDLVVRVPAGTVVKDAETGEIIADLMSNGQKLVVAQEGAWTGNARFCLTQIGCRG